MESVLAWGDCIYALIFINLIFHFQLCAHIHPCSHNIYISTFIHVHIHTYMYVYGSLWITPKFASGKSCAVKLANLCIAFFSPKLDSTYLFYSHVNVKLRFAKEGTLRNSIRYPFQKRPPFLHLLKNIYIGNYPKSDINPYIQNNRKGS